MQRSASHRLRVRNVSGYIRETCLDVCGRKQRRSKAIWTQDCSNFLLALLGAGLGYNLLLENLGSEGEPSVLQRDNGSIKSKKVHASSQAFCLAMTERAITIAERHDFT